MRDFRTGTDSYRDRGSIMYTKWYSHVSEGRVESCQYEYHPLTLSLEDWLVELFVVLALEVAALEAWWPPTTIFIAFSNCFFM
jgi:hypothetical protein